MKYVIAIAAPQMIKLTSKPIKIIDPTGSKLELKMNVANRAEAITVFKKWNDSASEVYSELYKILIDGE